MNINRRAFIRSGSITLASFGLLPTAPPFLQRAALAQGLTDSRRGRRKTLIVIFQRGAVDGLNMVVPHGEASYYAMRPTLAIPAPPRGASNGSANREAAIDLDGFFGFHPALAPLKSLWDEKRLGIVHATGSPDNTRSHFDAQDYMESATPGVKSTADGWLNRCLQVTKTVNPSPFRAVSVTQNLPRALQGHAPALAIPNLTDFTIRAGSGNAASVQGGFEAIYEQSVSDVLRGTGRETFEAVKFLKDVNPAQYRPEGGARYPRGRFGESLLQIAQLIKADVGLEVAFTDIGGWDTHVNQGAARGQLALRLEELGAGIKALTVDLGARMDDLVILTMSEFGRTARENGSRGTDHGHANAMLVIGGPVRGGRVHGEWPGLGSNQLYEERDLALTTDFRDVFGEVAHKHLGNSDLRKVFPGYAAHAAKFRHVLG